MLKINWLLSQSEESEGKMNSKEFLNCKSKTGSTGTRDSSPKSEASSRYSDDETPGFKVFSGDVVAGVFILLLVITGAWYEFTMRSSLKNDLKAMQTLFPEQQAKTWRTVTRALRPLVTDGGEGPAVILIVVPPGSDRVADKLVRALSRLCKKVLRSEDMTRCDNINGAWYSKPGSGPLFYEHVVDVLEKEKVAVVTDIQSLGHESAAMFLGFRNCVTSAIRKSVLLVTLSVPDRDVKGYDVRAPEVVAYDYLKRAWGGALKGFLLEELVERLLPWTIKVVPDSSSRA